MGREGRKMRLIDADELRAKLNKAVENAVEDHCEYASAFTNAAQEWSAELWTVEDTIDDVPTVDAVPVIRCKDCKKWKRNDGTFPDFDGKEWHKCEALEQYRHVDTCDIPVMPAWFYCGYSERKEE